uniref:Putative RNA ligase n=1 Tax=viral metagenome TaxID=1070528 RepID=A0A6M3LCK7_9ZZZZ
MREYHKIPTVFSRDPSTNYKTLILGKYATKELEYLKDNIWCFSEKVDGTNIRVMFDPTLGITFGGKTDRAQIPALLVNKLNEIFLPQIGIFEDNFEDGVCLYGEGYGAKIQKGGGNYNPTGVDFALFDIKIGDWWLQRKDVEDIAMKFGIEIVPIIGNGTLDRMIEIVKSEDAISSWATIDNPFRAEGIVARPEVELKTRSGERIITKIKHKDF